MSFQQLIKRWDLESEAEYGLFDLVKTSFGGVWAKEDEDRIKAFAQLPIFDVKGSDVLKRKARTGIPNGQRRKWWLVASRGFKLLSRAGDLWDQAKSESPPLGKPEEFFGLPSYVFSFLPPRLAKKSQLLCHVLAQQNDEVVFAPLIPVFSSMLLLFMETPLAYLTLQSMINQSKKEGYYFPVTNEQFTTWMQLFREMLKKKCESVSKHAEAMKLDIGQLGLALFPVFFFPFMSLPVALTFFDSFVVSGRKVLIRFCLSLFANEKKSLLAATTPTEFVSVVINAIERLQNIDAMKEFLKKTFLMDVSKLKKMQKLKSSAATPTKPARERRITFDQTAKDIQNIVRTVQRSLHRTRSSHVMQNLAQRDFHGAARAMQAHIFNRMLPAIYGGKLLDNAMYCVIRHQLTPVLMRYSLTRVFSSVEHGPSFETMYKACSDATPYILVVKTSSGMFGALISDRLAVRQSPDEFYGTALTFVFNVDTQQLFRVPKPPNTMFLCANHDSLLIGGPDPAIQITDRMQKLTSKDCATFGSPSFTGTSDPVDIVEVELYTLWTVKISAPPLQTQT